MTKIPLHTLFNNCNSDRSIYNTRKNEVRYFLIDGGDGERQLRVTGTPDGGLQIEKLEDGKWSINSTAAPRLGDATIEVPFIQ